VFGNWTGDVKGIENPSQNPVTFPMGDDRDNNRTITANFAASSARYTVTAGPASNGGGSVSVTPAQADYLINQTVTINAAADTGYIFSHWEGDLAGAGSSATLFLDYNKTVTAIFNPTVIVQSSPEAGGTVELIPAQPSTGYQAGTEVIVYAKPGDGYRFESWKGDVSGSSASMTVTMDTPKAITATFNPTVTVQSDPLAGGSVELVPAQPSSGYLVGAQITIRAEASKGYKFKSWGGGLSGSQETVTLTVDGPKAVTALFVKQSEGYWRWWVVLGVTGLVATLAVFRVFHSRMRGQS
jgi:hypothetical protein